MRLLSHSEYLQTFGEARSRVPVDAEPPFDFWLYFDAIPDEDFEGHDFTPGEVDYAWRIEPRQFEHVLVRSKDQNVFMVLVLDLFAGTVYGHKLLDLNREYGLDE